MCHSGHAAVSKQSPLPARHVDNMLLFQLSVVGDAAAPAATSTHAEVSRAADEGDVDDAAVDEDLPSDPELDAYLQVCVSQPCQCRCASG